MRDAKTRLLHSARAGRKFLCMKRRHSSCDEMEVPIIPYMQKFRQKDLASDKSNFFAKKSQLADVQSLFFTTSPHYSLFKQTKNLENLDNYQTDFMSLLTREKLSDTFQIKLSLS